MNTETLVRDCDPQTSHDAAERIASKLTTRCQQFLEGLNVLKQATANEVAAHVAGENVGLLGSIRRRASDLHRLGYVVVVDRRRCKVTGQPVNVYEAVKHEQGGQ